MKHDRLVFPIVFLAAAGVAFALFWGRLGRRIETPTTAPSAAASEPTTIAVASTSVVSASFDDAGTKPPPLPPDYVHRNPLSEEACGKGMILIDGIYCPYVGHTCTRFLDEEKDVCQSYAPDVLCEGRLEHRRYCIDEFEYPNIEGVVPAVMVDWNDARRACDVESKRLCTVEEWQFACEGPQMWPYPYGTERDAKACNIDREWTEPVLEAFSDPWKISAEVERLDKRVPSGSLDRCVSPFGVHDMTGNVDEWVMNDAGKRDEKPFKSTLKGGYWGPIRARCRPITSTHNEWFSFYQVGFRCCADVKGTPPMTPATGIQRPRKQRMP